MFQGHTFFLGAMYIPKFRVGGKKKSDLYLNWELLQVILFEIDFAIFCTNLHELLNKLGKFW